MIEDSPPIVRIEKITKVFPENNVRAADSVSLELYPGEVRSLVGENGAGKSTIMHILSGNLAPNSGSIRLNERRVRFSSPGDAILEGIVMVHQHPPLIPDFRVWESLFLGIEPTRFGFIDRRTCIATLERICEQYGLSFDPRARVADLAASQLHLAAIAGALLRKPRVLILDEPTAPCTDPEVETIFSVIRAAARKGVAVVLITHKIREVMRISDSITVMRNGRVVTTVHAAETDGSAVSAAIMGVERPAGPKASTKNETATGSREDTGQPSAIGAHPRLSVESLSLTVNRREVLRDISFTVGAGEVFGVTGIRENGLEFLEDVLAGLIAPTRGRMCIDGVPIARYSPREFRRHGISYVPTDRIFRGASLDSSVTENLILNRRHRLGFAGVFDRDTVRGFAGSLMNRFDIVGHAHGPLRTLSGGNIQKVILSRELAHPGPIVVFSEPSWGLDVRSRDMMYAEIHRLRADGHAIVLISVDIDEVLELADRVGVMYAATMIRTLTGSDRSRKKIGELMLGLADRTTGGILR